MACQCTEEERARQKAKFEQQQKANVPIYALDEVKRFMSQCLQAAGAPKENAQVMAELLAEADYRGHASHGMNRLGMYVNDLQAGACDGAAIPEILQETYATAWVDGHNGLGAVVAHFCMDLAIEKAKEVGVGCVVCKGSNHYGVAQMYSIQAQKQGMIGFTASNTSPFMAPTRAKKAALGTNPLSFAAPPYGPEGMMLDMATTAVAVGKIEMKKRKNEPIPPGWAIDNQGNVTTDPNAFAALMPLGGEESNSGFKGYGLALMVEALSGILADAAFGPYIKEFGDASKTSNLGQFFLAINPNCFAPCFEDRMEELTTYIRKLEPVNKDRPVLVPGDFEISQMKIVDEAGGVQYVPNQIETCKKLAAELRVPPLQPCRR